MPVDRAFPVRLVRLGPGLPYFEVGAYHYVAEELPARGTTITINRVVCPDGLAPDEIRAYVTRVNPMAETPISATEVETEPSLPEADYLA